MSHPKPYANIPGTIVFDGAPSPRGISPQPVLHVANAAGESRALQARRAGLHRSSGP